MTLLRAVATWCVCFALILSSCGGDSTARLASAIEELCDACPVLGSDDCVDHQWRIAALYQHLWGDKCVDSLVLGLECLAERRVCDPSAPTWMCETVDGLESCELGLPCHAEQVTTQAACTAPEY